MAIIVAILLLKNPITAVFEAFGKRLQKLKGKASGIELEADFGKSVDKVEEMSSSTKPLVGTDNIQKLELKEELSRLPPRYVVSQAWLKLESAIKEAVNEDFAREDAKTLGAMRSRPSTNLYLNFAMAKGILSVSDIEAVQELRQLRNRAAHDLNPDVSVTDALRYSDIADGLYS